MFQVILPKHQTHGLNSHALQKQSVLRFNETQVLVGTLVGYNYSCLCW